MGVSSCLISLYLSVYLSIFLLYGIHFLYISFCVCCVYVGLIRKRCAEEEERYYGSRNCEKVPYININSLTLCVFVSLSHSLSLPHSICLMLHSYVCLFVYVTYQIY